MGAFDPIVTYEKGTYIGESTWLPPYLLLILRPETDTGSELPKR